MEEDNIRVVSKFLEDDKVDGRVASSKLNRAEKLVP